MSFTSIIPKTDLDHILDTFSDLADDPSTLDVDGAPIASKTLRMEQLEVMIDDINVEIVVSASDNQPPQILSISMSMVTDNELVTADSVYPEVRFRLYASSNHSLAWDGITTTQGVVTPERMKAMMKIVSHMKARMFGLFDDESMT